MEKFTPPFLFSMEVYIKYVKGVMFINNQQIPVKQPITAEEFTQQFMFMKMNSKELQVGDVQGYIILEDEVHKQIKPSE